MEQPTIMTITTATSDEYRQFCMTMTDKTKATTADPIKNQKYLSVTG
jgi:hypothetical protein